jgi:hypothetical protein
MNFQGGKTDGVGDGPRGGYSDDFLMMRTEDKRVLEGGLDHDVLLWSILPRFPNVIEKGACLETEKGRRRGEGRTEPQGLGTLMNGDNVASDRIDPSNFLLGWR